VKQKIKEKSDIEEFIKQESSVKKHIEPNSFKGNSTTFATSTSLSSDNGYIAAQITDCFCHLMHTLVAAYAVGNREGN
jgi:predicted MPP superfamily phosphohydrolase